MLPRAPQSGQHSPEASKITGGGRPPRVENNWRNTLEPLPCRATGPVPSPAEPVESSRTDPAVLLQGYKAKGLPPDMRRPKRGQNMGKVLQKFSRSPGDADEGRNWSAEAGYG